MNVLVLNCGSSSIKFEVIAPGGDGGTAEQRLAKGSIERIGGRAALSFEAGQGAVRREKHDVPDHADGVRRMLDWLSRSGVAAIDAVGHRVVHGGERLTRPVVLDEGAVEAIEALETLAPLHNAPSLEGIRACRSRLGPSVPMVAVFDTAFHAGLPEVAHRYAIPHELASRHGIRRFGFHGTSYRYVLARYAALAGRAERDVVLVALHLGNGCSAAAIRDGRSIDTSMGLTPLEGLVMGTRAGDLDPAIVGVLARAERVGVEEVERWLNDDSGLKGLSGGVRDMRDLLAREREDPRARLAVDVFCYRARKYVGAYLAALGGAHAVVFTGGIGEHAPEVRTRICAGMEWCGIVVDRERNAAADGVEARISRDDARVHVWVIPTDEAIVIARDTVACVA
jgi:acetate kinase